MKDSISPFQCGMQNVRLHNVATDIINFDARVVQRLEKIFSPTTDKVVIDQNFLDVLFNELIGSMGAYKACAANENDFFTLNDHFFWIGLLTRMGATCTSGVDPRCSYPRVIRADRDTEPCYSHSLYNYECSG